jgi:phosphatidylglycerophosphate synthase
MLKERFGPSLDRVVLWIAPAVASLPLSANQLTALGGVASLAVGAAFAWGHTGLAGVLLLLAGFADLADGIVARARGTESRAGAFLDSSMDRVSDLLIYAGMAVDAAWRMDPARALLVTWALGAAFVTSYARARAECEIDELKVGFMERGERFLVLIPLALLDRLGLALWILALGGTLTSIQRIRVGYQRIAARASATPAQSPDASGGGSITGVSPSRP